MEELEGINKVFDKDDIDVVLYHGSCSDGFGSAFVVWYYLKTSENIEILEQSKLSSIGSHFGDGNRILLDQRGPNGTPCQKEVKFIPCYFFKEGESLDKEFLNQMTGKNILMCDF